MTDEQSLFHTIATLDADFISNEELDERYEILHDEYMWEQIKQAQDEADADAGGYEYD